METRTHISSLLTRTPKVLILGLTGSGKSELGNSLSGSLNTKLFISNSDADSCTTEPEIREIEVLGQQFQVIDTPGWGDSKGNDQKHQAALVKILQASEYISSFILVFNGQECRFNEFHQQMLQAYADMFPNKFEFLKHSMIVFTRWQTDQQSIIRRNKNKDMQEDSKVDQINQQIKEKLGFDTEKHPLRAKFIDNSLNESEVQDQIKDLHDGQRQIDDFKNSVFSIHKFILENFKNGIIFETKNAHILRMQKEKEAGQRLIQLELRQYFQNKDNEEGSFYKDLIEIGNKFNYKGKGLKNSSKYLFMKRFQEEIEKQLKPLIVNKIRDVILKIAQQFYWEIKDKDYGVDFTKTNIIILMGVNESQLYHTLFAPFLMLSLFTISTNLVFLHYGLLKEFLWWNKEQAVQNTVDSIYNQLENRNLFEELTQTACEIFLNLFKLQEEENTLHKFNSQFQPQENSLR